MDNYQITIESWNKVAQQYQDKFMDMDLYDDTYDVLSSHLPLSANVLEIGCGPGNISKYLLKQRPDLHILGTDAAPAMIDLAQKNNPAAKFRVIDCRDISSLTDRYHAIICGFVAPLSGSAGTCNITQRMHKETIR